MTTGKMISRTLFYIVIGICAIFLIWVFASWVNVVAHNTTDYVYAPWNFFYYLLDFGNFIHAHSFGVLDIFIG